MVLFAALVTVSAVISRRFVPAFIILGYVASWMMWVPGNERRVLFFYHALGMLLFTALALAYALTAIRGVRIPFGGRRGVARAGRIRRHRERARGVHLLLPDLDRDAAELGRPADEGLGRRRVTAFLVILDAAFTLAAGAALVGLVRTHLTLLERVTVGLTSGLIIGTALTYGLSLLFGLNRATVLLGPALTLAGALAVSLLTVNPRATWHASWVEARDRWAAHTPWFSIVALVGGTLAVVAIFGHTVYTDAGGLEAGYPTVWADWSQHLTTAASFASGGNIPPVNPLFSGTTLLYPFLPDFHAATLMALGLAPGLALAIPGGLLMVVIGLLVVALGRRLGLGTGAGVIALLICFIGGGLGFIGAFADACTSHGYTATECTLQYVVTHPGTGVSIVGWTLHDLPGTIAAQPRAYDGLPSDGGTPPLPDMEWYTPLMAWWLPQRTLLFGFAAAVSVLVLVLAGASSNGRTWEPFVLAGVLIGLLPIVHVQTLIALSILLFVLLWRRRRREWWALLGVAVVLGGIRLGQLVLSQHGAAVTPYGTNVYPYLEPGWLANAGSSPTRVVASRSPSATSSAAPSRRSGWSARRSGGDSGLPISASPCPCSRSSRSRPVSGSLNGKVGRVVTAALPVPLLELALGALIIFAACNLVVFQSWNWDNTKLLVYWYLVIALLIGAVAANWWRRVWPRVAAILLVAPVLLTGALVVLRLLPWTPPQDSITGPYTIANTQELQLASTIDRVTPKGSVFLTFGRPNDPVLTVAGRIGVMGYGGWLWSYGISFETRFKDVQTMYTGCAADPATCPVFGLLRKYDISYVEIDDRLTDPGAIDAAGGRHVVGGSGASRRCPHRPHHHLRRPRQRLT